MSLPPRSIQGMTSHDVAQVGALAATLWHRYDSRLHRTTDQQKEERIQLEERDDARLRQLIELGMHEASFVQCVGMPHPIHISSIYQPRTLLRSRSGSHIEVEIDDVLNNAHGSIVFAPPGHGKSMFLNSMLLRLHNDPHYLPVMVILRQKSAIGSLSIFIKNIVPRLRLLQEERIVLLVDGYDEVEVEQRRTIAQLLKRFSITQRGTFVMTCRSFYDVADVHANTYSLSGFTKDDATRFITDFSRAQDWDINAENLVNNLIARHFDDFLANPLLLSLTCVLKAGSLRELPHTSLALIDRAINTLTFRWDLLRNVNRQSTLGLDGRHHLACLRRIAFDTRTLVARSYDVALAAQQQLKTLQRSEIPPNLLLTELAQWYGLLVPGSGDTWSWTHRTIHDFLAAEYWVQSGTFSVGRIHSWNTRAAYAACLTPDATAFLVAALTRSSDIHVVAECLRNDAPFDPAEVANAVIQHYNSFPEYERTMRGREVWVKIPNNFIPLGSPEFLTSLLVAGLKRSSRTPAHDVVTAAAVHEVKRRQIPIAPSLINQLRLLGERSGQFVLVEDEDTAVV